MGAHTSVSTARSSSPDLRGQLERLLVLAATAELDAETLTTIRKDAVDVTNHLADRGLIPAHLTVRPADPPVVVARTLGAIGRRLSSVSSGRW